MVLFKNKLVIATLWLSLITITAVGQVSSLYKPIYNNPWKSDTVFKGAGILAQDSSKEILVSSYNFDLWNSYLGELYYLDPRNNDTAIFLFHNKRTLFPFDSQTINIGKFFAGTPIVFVFKFIDTTMPRWVGECNYTGQNRSGIDKYISDFDSEPGDSQCTVAGRIDSSLIEIGFDDNINRVYRNAVLNVTNVQLECLEMNKMPLPHIEPIHRTFGSQASIILSIPKTGLLSIVRRGTIVDTATPLQTGATLRFYYTLDGSSPVSSPTRQLYSSPFIISESTTIQSYAFFEGADNWYPSEIAEALFIKNPTHVKPTALSSHDIKNMSNPSIYSINGRRISRTTRRNMNLGANGIYLIQTNSSGSLKRTIVVDNK